MFCVSSSKHPFKLVNSRTFQLKISLCFVTGICHVCLYCDGVLQDGYVVNWLAILYVSLILCTGDLDRVLKQRRSKSEYIEEVVRLF